MKLLIILILSFNAFGQDSFRPTQDKLLHFSVGTAVGFTSTHLMLKSGNYKPFDAVLGAQFIMLPIGFGKELYDARFGSGYFSTHDIFYNQLGALIGSGAKLGVSKLIERHNKKHTPIKL